MKTGLLTGLDLTVNETEVEWAGTVTVVGAVRALFPERIWTTLPDGPAGPVRVTVTADSWPPISVVVEATRLERVAGSTVKTAL